MKRVARNACRTPRRVLTSTLVLSLLPLAACSWGSDESGSSRASVGADGVAVVTGSVEVSGGPGVAPEGTFLTVAEDGAPEFALPELALPLGTGAGIEMQGLQPATPLTLAFPLAEPPANPEAVAILAVVDGTTAADLLPAQWDAPSSRLIAQTDHLSWFQPVALDLDAMGRVMGDLFTGTAGITTPRPDCVGRPLDLGDGGTVTLGETDWANQRPPVIWPCLDAGDDVALTLSSSSPLPWRVRADGGARLRPVGAIDIGDAAVLAGYNLLVTSRPYAEGLLVPGGQLTYDFPSGSLPARAELKADLGAHLALSVVFTVEYLFEVFGLDPPSLLENAATLECVAEQANAAQLSSPPSLAAFTSLAQAVISCIDVYVKQLSDDDERLPPLAGVVLAIVGSGAAVVWAGFEGAARTLTNTDQLTVPLEVARPQVAERALSGTTPIGLRGIGPIEAGMTLGEAERAAGVRFEVEEFETFDGYCYFAHAVGLEEDFSMLVESPGSDPVLDPLQGVIGRVSASIDMASPAQTVSGIGIGSLETDVFSAYPGQIETEPHAYEENGRYLTFVPRDPEDQGYRLRFVTDGQTVQEIHAGTAGAAGYIEGCA